MEVAHNPPHHPLNLSINTWLCPRHHQQHGVEQPLFFAPRRIEHGERVGKTQEGCPCQIDFSRAACRETSAMGKSTSASRLHSLGSFSTLGPHKPFETRLYALLFALLLDVELGHGAIR